MTDAAKIDKLARAVWEFYYPDGGSRYKTYDSLPQHDKDAHTEDAKKIAAFLEGKADIIQV